MPTKNFQVSNKIPPAIYNAHPVTGEYIGESLADPDPMDDSNWLIPAHAYLDAPPSPQKNKAAVRAEDGWTFVDDYRGTIYYLDGPQRHVIEELGITAPKGATSEPPEPTVAELTSTAFANRDNLLFTAGLRIAPLQDAEDIGDATADDQKALKAWKTYRVAVNRVSEQADFPKSITWPIPPSQ
ncbi:tail fiber assembly protein [Pseudomonas tolaasii]